MGVLKNGWFIRDNPDLTWMLGGPLFWGGNHHMSGGLNDLLPAMDMAKVGPLSLVKVFAQI